MRMLPTQTSRRRDPFTSLFDSFFSDSLPELFTNDHLPRTNIAEDQTSYLVSLELPGIDEQDIDVQVEGDRLVVRAERKSETEEKDRKWHRVEHRYGAISRVVSLPKDARADAIEAVYRRGVLSLTIPKAEEAQPRKIQIKAD